MTAGKRASMREGPLAALFRRTTEDAPASGRPVPEEESPKATEPESPRQEYLPEPGAHASHLHRAVPAAQQPPLPRATPEVPATSQLAPEPEEAPITARPCTDASTAPQQRMLNAFSAEVRESAVWPPEHSSQPSQERTPGSLPPPPSVERSAPAPPAPTVAPSLPAAPHRADERPADRRPLGRPLLRVVGVGGAGSNAINRMVEAEIEGVEFVAINTDAQSLQQSAAHQTLQIGDSITRGLGTGADPELGRESATRAHDRVKALLRGSDMVFIAAGEGGGTGTGAAPVVAEIARDLGALTVAIVTRPFQFEGIKRQSQAEAGIAALADHVDTLIVVPNNRLLTVLDRNTSMMDAFKVADDVLRQGVQGIADLVTLPGLINLDFADVRTIMSDAGTALLGIGIGSGERRAIEAAEQAVASPLLDTSMDGARSILLSITGGRDLSLWEVNESARAVADAAHPDANIIFGAMIDERLSEQVWVTVIATGYGDGRGSRRGSQVTARGSDRGPGLGASARRTPRQARAFDDLDVPEFILRR